MSYRTEVLKRGRKPIFATAQDLWDTFYEYVAFVEAFPIDLPTTVVKGSTREEGRGGKVARPLTKVGFRAFCGIASEWADFAKYQRSRGADFSEVISRVEAIIEQDQIEGGLAGVYSSNLTARLNGLADKQDVTSDGKPLDRTVVVVDKASEG